eukprot:CAMPEP_0173449526 /NCGR_PEP_ID=MMETSP1357-20121228/42902_1 /TAXON_ID=77926 /ORGANISM="Hemiselmis rufescens, Strain PCC563" /LENGTH=128 /DNA_ID=CAMNT_0014416129 /DNA_START=83 /DNA_END=470 /DNA_ORIENTATION=-
MSQASRTATCRPPRTCWASKPPPQTRSGTLAPRSNQATPPAWPPSRRSRANVLKDVEAVPDVAPPLEVDLRLLRLCSDPLGQQVVGGAPALVLLQIVGYLLNIPPVEYDPAQPVADSDAAPTPRKVGV